MVLSTLQSQISCNSGDASGKGLSGHVTNGNTLLRCAKGIELSKKPAKEADSWGLCHEEVQMHFSNEKADI